MSELSKRATVYFDPAIHQALKIKAVTTQQSLSDIVDSALRQQLSEDQEDLSAIASRISEPEISYESLLDDLKKHGKI
ncbi:MAG: CopG family transcriptional regulator [Gammaproteobacteria bacterium]|nr:CopG family transcriptional regulator [Gammaproteobacteria bacterium]